MDGFSITLYLKQLLMVLALIDPAISTDDIASVELPTIISASMVELQQGKCGCDCDDSVMVGNFFLDANDKPTIVIATPENGDLSVSNPRVDALMVHELTHYIQYLKGQYNGMFKDGMQSLSDEEIAEIKETTETQAYQNQNKFLTDVGLQPLDISSRVAWSANAGSCGETTMASKD